MKFEVVRELAATDIVDLLRQGKISFVVADVDTLKWIPVEQCYAFWKSQVKPRLVDPATAEVGFFLEDFPGGYCYLAEQCHSEGVPIVILRMFH